MEHSIEDRRLESSTQLAILQFCELSDQAFCLLPFAFCLLAFGFWLFLAFGFLVFFLLLAFWRLAFFGFWLLPFGFCLLAFWVSVKVQPVVKHLNINNPQVQSAPQE